MKKEYQINGIGCGGCIARVKKALEAHPAIISVEMFLTPKKGMSLISMTKELSVAELQKQLNIIEGFTITELN
tara:strand:+ start:6415 stop:6633 length:219 start_codon:yes stop_codon:yes gene_type:complete